MSGKVDSYELKFTVPDGREHEVAEALKLDPLDARIRQVFFFDTPDLALSGSGLVLRARRTQRRDPDTVVKLRPVAPEAIPGEWRDRDDLSIEVDMVGADAVCSASLKAARDEERVADVTAGRKPVEKLFSSRQHAFIEELSGVAVDWNGVHSLGPVNVHKLKTYREPLGMKVAVELWRYPDDSYLLELSVRCTPDEVFTVHERCRARLEELGYGIEGNQETKTKRALAYFAGQIA